MLAEQMASLATKFGVAATHHWAFADWPAASAAGAAAGSASAAPAACCCFHAFSFSSRARFLSCCDSAAGGDRLRQRFRRQS